MRCEAHDRKRLENLWRCITRPALSDERVQRNAALQLELKLKRPWCDGTTHLVMSPLEFMRRLAAQAPMLRGPLLSPPRDACASDWFLPTNSEQRMSPTGRQCEFNPLTSRHTGWSLRGRWYRAALNGRFENSSLRSVDEMRLLYFEAGHWRVTSSGRMDDRSGRLPPVKASAWHTRPALGPDPAAVTRPGRRHRC